MRIDFQNGEQAYMLSRVEEQSRVLDPVAGNWIMADDRRTSADF
jgi:hypothetical protein